MFTQKGKFVLFLKSNGTALQLVIDEPLLIPHGKMKDFASDHVLPKVNVLS